MNCQTYIPTVDAIIQHCLRTYGGTIAKRSNTLDIKIGSDRFHVNVTDGNRFGKFTLYHRNRQRALDGKYHYHKQGNYGSLAYAIYVAFTHEFTKVLDIGTSQEDYRRFKQDALKYYNPWLETTDSLGGDFFY